MLRPSFETPRSLSSGAHSRDPLAAPQDEVESCCARGRLAAVSLPVIRQGTNSPLPAYRRRFENREVSMKLVGIVLAGSLLTVVPSLAWAQQSLTGTIVIVDRINGTIGIQQAQGGTVGAGAGGATQQLYKAPDGMLDKWHAGDRVTFSVGETGGRKTITKIENE
jgi:hypothetical protein